MKHIIIVIVYQGRKVSKNVRNRIFTFALLINEAKFILPVKEICHIKRYTDFYHEE